MSHLRLMFRQILPNLVSTIVVIATLKVGQGDHPGVVPDRSWASACSRAPPGWGMLGEGRLYMLDSWWIAPTFPGLAIFLTTP